jgi:hypothetical protein
MCFRALSILDVVISWTLLLLDGHLIQLLRRSSLTRFAHSSAVPALASIPDWEALPPRRMMLASCSCKDASYSQGKAVKKLRMPYCAVCNRALPSAQSLAEGAVHHVCMPPLMSGLLRSPSPRFAAALNSGGTFFSRVELRACF